MCRLVGECAIPDYLRGEVESLDLAIMKIERVCIIASRLEIK
jgi:hypothetical protein